MRVIAVVLVMLFQSGLISTAYAIDKCGKGPRTTCVIDGDTFWLDGEKIRMMDFDTPEPQTNICGGAFEKDLAKKASDRVVEIFNTASISINRKGKDKYGRTLAIVFADGINIGEILISEGLARKWPDGEEFWCR